MISAADMQLVGWPDPASVVDSMDSRRSFCAILASEALSAMVEILSCRAPPDASSLTARLRTGQGLSWRVLCPSCQSENDDAAEVCFNCRAVLTAVTRGTLIDGRYRILAPLGRGGMGAVYRARDEVLDDEVALKILRPEVAGTTEMAARFRSEIKLARKVSHWNVCRIHEYGEEGGLQYISMELIAGATLKDRLRGGALPPDQAFDVAIQIAEGL